MCLTKDKQNIQQNLFQSFPFLVLKSTMTMASKAAKSAATFLFGGEIFPTSSTVFTATTTPHFSDPVIKDNNIDENHNDVYDYYDKDSTNDFDNDESLNHLGSNPGPPYSSNVPQSLELQNNNDNNNNNNNNNDLTKNFSISGSVRNNDLDPGTLAYDPVPILYSNFRLDLEKKFLILNLPFSVKSKINLVMKHSFLAIINFHYV